MSPGSNDGANSYSRLALRLERDLPFQQRGRTVLVAAADDDRVGIDAVTELAWHLADELGHSVLVVDGTFGLAALSEAFGVAGSPGVMELLADGGIGRGVLRAAAVPTQHEQVWLLPRGRGDNGRLIAVRSDALRELLLAAAEAFDFVLVLGSLQDSSSRSMAFGGFVDGALLVALEGRTLLSSIQQGQRVLNESGAARVGLVLAGPVTTGAA
jgi:hypothetical protein